MIYPSGVLSKTYLNFASRNHHQFKFTEIPLNGVLNAMHVFQMVEAGLVLLMVSSNDTPRKHRNNIFRDLISRTAFDMYY